MICRSSARLCTTFDRRGRAVCPTCGQLVKVDGPDHSRRYASHHNPQTVPNVRNQ